MTEGNCVGITNFILSKLSIGFLKFQKIEKIELFYCFSKKFLYCLKPKYTLKLSVSTKNLMIIYWLEYLTLFEYSFC